MEQNAVHHREAWFIPSHSIRAQLQWAVVAQNIHGASYLFFVPLCATDAGERTFQQLRACYQAATRTACQENWIVLLLTRTVVGTAKIQWIGSTLGNEHYERVNITDCRDDSVLTEAFLNPDLMVQERTYAQDNRQFIVAATERRINLAGKEVVLIRRVFDKGKIAWLLISMLVISPAIGTLVGRYSHRADAGVAVSAAIFALASFLQGLLAWLQV